MTLENVNEEKKMGNGSVDGDMAVEGYLIRGVDVEKMVLIRVLGNVALEVNF